MTSTNLEQIVQSQINVSKETGEGESDDSKTISLDILDEVLEFSCEKYGNSSAFSYVIKEVFEELLVRKSDQWMIESNLVQEAAKDLSKHLGAARLGHTPVIGGFQKNSDPVIMMSIERLFYLVGDAMNKKTLVNLLPASRPPLSEDLDLTSGSPASSSAVRL